MSGYTLDGNRVHRVTTLVSRMDPPYLLGWVARSVADMAVDDIDALAGMSPTAAKAWLLTESERRRNLPRDLGGAVHDAIHLAHSGITAPVPTAVQPYLDSWRMWADAAQLDVEESERVVVGTLPSGRHYAGRFDMVATIRGRRFLLDIKTGRRVYPSTALQLAAYRYADTMWPEAALMTLSSADDTVLMPSVDGATVVHVRPEGTTLVDLDSSVEVWKAFATMADALLEWDDAWSRFR